MTVLLPAGGCPYRRLQPAPGLPTARNPHVMGLPARIAKPQNLIGLTDQLDSPAYATSVGFTAMGTPNE